MLKAHCSPIKYFIFVVKEIYGYEKLFLYDKIN